MRRAESGESVVVTVSGRPAARLVPIGGRQWRRWDQVEEVLSGPGAPDIAQDLASVDGSPRDPFDR